MEKVLFKLDSTGLKFKNEKFKFAVSEATFQGHNIDASITNKISNKAHLIMAASEPRGKTEMQDFLGLLAFYDCFLQNRATVTADL